MRRIQPGPVENVVTIVEVDRLFHRACVDTGEAPQDAGEGAIADGVVVRPRSSAAFPTSAAPETAASSKASAAIGIHEAANHKFIVVQIVRGNWLVVVAFLADESAERHLKRVDRR